MKRIILASNSPRRREMMDSLNINYQVIPSTGKEIRDESLPIEKQIEQLALNKANSVFQDNKDALVIGADTIVVIDNKVLGKPKTKQEAKEMMELLSNRVHQVITGIAFVSDKEVYVDHDVTNVKFTAIPTQAILDYIETDEAYDKAGGYAIQGWAARYIEKIDGNYNTVVGLPLYKVNAYLEKWN